MADQEQIEQEGGSIDFEAEATEMGWVPEDKYRGPKDKWVDAKTFYERGEHLFPIIKATNKRLKAEALTRDSELASVKSALEASQRAIKALQKSHSQNVQAQVDAAVAKVKEQIKAAREAGDTDAELDLQEELVDLRNASKEAKETQEGTDTDQGDGNQPKLDPRFVTWQKEHPWFGRETKEDRIRSRQLVRIGEDLIEEGTSLQGTAFMDECLRILEEREGNTSNTTANAGRKTSKVEGGGGNNRSSNPTGFESLPKEAKDACHDDNDVMVGTGPGQFKTIKEWETYYYKQYMEN